MPWTPLNRRPAEVETYYERVAANGPALVVKRAAISYNTDPDRVALPYADAQLLRAKYRHATELLASPRGLPNGS